MSGKNPERTARFLAVVRYELLWNLRKKKFVGMLIVAFALATLALSLGHVVQALGDQPVEPNPDFVIGSNIGLGGFGFFLFAIVTVMNTISGEFESGTIVPLLAKPVSRTTVFLGKLCAAFLMLLATYCFLMIYITIGGSILYGPQDNLHLVPLSLLGALFSTFIWVSIVLFFGTLFRSSLIAALAPLGIWFGTTIIGQIVTVLAGQGWILTYIPGAGTIANANGGPPSLFDETGYSISTGTDSIGPNLVNYFLHPTWEVTYYRIDLVQIIPGQTVPDFIPLYSEPFFNVVLTSIAVAAVYFIVFTMISWYIFKRAQVTE